LNNDALLQYIYDLGGAKNNILQDETVKEQFLKLLRNDLSMNESVDKNAKPIHAPISFFYAKDDVALNKEDAQRWETMTEGSFTLYSVHGDHFFVNDKQHIFYSTLNNIIANH